MSETKSLIDVASFQTIINYLLFDPEITGIVVVSEEVELSDVGDLMINQAPEAFEEFKSLMKEGKIIILPGTNGGFALPPHYAVHCLRLSPFYVVKDLKKPYL